MNYHLIKFPLCAMHQVSRAMPLKHLSIVMQRPLHAFFTSTSHLNNSVAARRRSINASSGLRNEKDDRKVNGKMLMIAKQVVKDSDEFFNKSGEAEPSKMKRPACLFWSISPRSKTKISGSR